MSENSQKRNAAVLFPGIGYNFDRPLMHFAREQAMQYGYEVIEVGYSGFPKKIRGDKGKMKESLDIATTQAEQILQNVNWADYTHIIFFSKSIGTIVATQYAAKHHIAATQILFTPFPETFLPFGQALVSTDFGSTSTLEPLQSGTTETIPVTLSTLPLPVRAIAFHAQTDPWMDDAEVIRAAAAANVPMKLYPSGNHSLETGDTLEDIRILEEVFTLTRKYFHLCG